MPREESLVDWSLPGSDDELIFGTSHLPAPSRTPVGVVLVCHGFKGYKDYGFFPYLASSLARDGFVAHRFNFSHSGITPIYTRFERTDLFEKDTWSRQIHDLSAVHDAVRLGRLPGPSGVETLPIIWFGHSRGGVTVLLTAAARPQPVNPNASWVDAIGPSGLITAAAPAYCSNLSDEEKQLMRTQGYLETASGRTGQTLRIGSAWLDEIERSPGNYDPVRAATDIRYPLLIIHAEGDETVPVESAHKLADAAGRNAELQIIQNSNHVFGAKNPMTGEPPLATQSLVEHTIDFCHTCASA